MRKSLIIAIVVEIIVLVIAFGFSIAYIQFGMGRENLVLNIGLVIVWVLVASVLLFVFWWRSLVREEMVRRFYISDEWVYNHEIGYAPLKRICPNGDAYGFVTFAADALAKMSYGFEVADAPEEFHPTFLIASRSFSFHFSGGDEEMGEEADGVVVDQWSGSLNKVTSGSGGGSGAAVGAGANAEPSYTEIGKFENARQLARLLEDNGAFDHIEMEEGE